MNQKGSVNVAVVILVVVLAIGLGYVTLFREPKTPIRQPSISLTPTPTTTPTPPTITITIPNGGENVTIDATNFNIEWVVSGVVDKESYHIGLSLEKNGVVLGAVSNKVSSANSSGYNWGWIGAGNYLDAAANLKTALAGSDYKIRARLFRVGPILIAQDESDDFFTISKSPPMPQTLVTPPTSLPTTCKDGPDATPVITSLSNYSGPIGAKLEIRGCNFSGFEGDKNAWIENSGGLRGILYGEAGSTSKVLKIILKSPLCRQDNSYSGLPCSAWLTLTPGVYKIYVIPWGKKSNEATFSIK